MSFKRLTLMRKLTRLTYLAGVSMLLASMILSAVSQPALAQSAENTPAPETEEVQPPVEENQDGGGAPESEETPEESSGPAEGDEQGAPPADPDPDPTQAGDDTLPGGEGSETPEPSEVEATPTEVLPTEEQPLPTGTPAPDMTPEKTFAVSGLSIASQCTDTGVLWTVSNPNDFDLPFTWELEDSGEDVAPAGGSIAFTSGFGAFTFNLSWMDEQNSLQTTQAEALCEPPAPLPAPDMGINVVKRVDKSSLSFSGGCDAACKLIVVEVCNTGDGDMTGSSSWELFYAASGNPKNGTVIDGGDIMALKAGQCQTLTYNPENQPGNYMFKAYQMPDHPGTGVLWSDECQIDTCTIKPTQPSKRGSVSFNVGDTGICEFQPLPITVTVSVSLPAGVSARLQTDAYVVQPEDLRTPHNYEFHNVQNGDSVDVTFEWPGVRPGDSVVEIHFGAVLLDENGDIISNSAGLDYFWNSYVCSPPVAPTPTPVPLLDLQLAYVCGGEIWDWVVTNPNGYAVDFTWSGPEGPGNGTVEADSSLTFLSTSGFVTVKVNYGPGNEREIAQTSGAVPCSAGGPTPVPTDPTPEGPDDPQQPGNDPTPTPGGGSPAGPQDRSLVSTPSAPSGSQVGNLVVIQQAAETVSEQAILSALADPATLATLPAPSDGSQQVLIPVTGADLAAPQMPFFGFAFLQKLLTNLGLVFLGMAFILDAAGRKMVA